VSPAVLEEYRATPVNLEERGKITHQQMKTLIAGIAAFVANAKIIHPVERLSICRDTEDNIILECCLAAKAKFLLTGDKDLLDTRDIPFELRIITPQEFLEF
jgi:putative PIN family toxin of toxin-antitoxin system